jgi:serine/threonine protein kinase
MGMVILAHDQELDRSVAIKVISIKPVPEIRARFEREARILARLEHPHVMRLYLADPWEDPPYLVTEFLSGADLHQNRPEDPLAVMLQVAEGLTAVHQLEVVHRDVKPANILLTDAGRAVLADFGLVTDDHGEDITRTHALVGTMMYLAPELLWGGVATPASDWYAWGASLYQLFEGQPPYTLDTLRGVLAGEELPAPAFAAIPEDGPVAHLLRDCLIAHAESRPAGLGAIRALLGDATPGPGPTSTAEVEVHAAPLPSTPRPTEVVPGPPAPTEVVPAADATDAAEAPPPRPGRPLGFAGALVFLGMLGLLGLRIAGTPEAPAAPPPTTQRPPPPLSPGDTHLEAAIAEFEAALDPGSASPSGTVESLQDAYRGRGVRAFAQLPQTMELIRWLQENRASDALREHLESHDRSLEALGMLPLFRPILTTIPLAPPDAFPERLRTWAAVRSADVGQLSERGPSWTAAALVHLGEGLEAHAAAKRTLRNLGPGLRRNLRESLAGLPLGLTRKLTPSMDLLQGVPALRPALDEYLSAGRRATRRFLLAAMQAAEKEPELSASFRSLWVAGASLLRGFLSAAFFDPPLALLFPDAPTTFPGRHLAVQVLSDARRRMRGLDRSGATSPEAEELRWAALHEVALSLRQRSIVLQGYLITAEAYRQGGDRARVEAVVRRIDPALREAIDVETGPVLEQIEAWLSRTASPGADAATLGSGTPTSAP